MSLCFPSADTIAIGLRFDSPIFTYETILAEAGIVLTDEAEEEKATEPKAEAKVKTKKELLALWDQATEDINRIWPTIPPHRFAEEDVAFGQWPGTGISFLFYFIDNEIHHRGQGYVYLRSLGIEPPPFWDR